MIVSLVLDRLFFYKGIYNNFISLIINVFFIGVLLAVYLELINKYGYNIWKLIFCGILISIISRAFVFFERFPDKKINYKTMFTRFISVLKSDGGTVLFIALSAMLLAVIYSFYYENLFEAFWFFGSDVFVNAFHGWVSNMENGTGTGAAKVAEKTVGNIGEVLGVLGTFGDFVSGTLGVTINMLVFGFVFFGYLAQRKELKNSEKALFDNKLASELQRKDNVKAIYIDYLNAEIGLQKDGMLRAFDKLAVNKNLDASDRKQYENLVKGTTEKISELSKERGVLLDELRAVAGISNINQKTSDSANTDSVSKDDGVSDVPH